MDLLSAASDIPRSSLAEATKALALDHGIYLGTSSWKYPGWLGTLYDEQRYLYRGKLAETRFERECLSEYAEVFPSVCVDAGYYRFPSPQYIDGLVRQVPAHFRFSFKVTDDITARTFPNLPRHGAKAGQRNEHFLDADLFKAAFLSSLRPHQANIGVIIFEFSHFHPRDFERGRDFLELLEPFLAAMPTGWQYAIEVRNKTLLCQPYFDLLQRYEVAHLFNHWDRMPPIGEQAELPGAHTTDFSAARLLLKPGRNYEEAVKNFSPYSTTKELNEPARSAAAQLIHYRQQRAKTGGQRRSYLYVNNRLEGNALNTILGILALAAKEQA